MSVGEYTLPPVSAVEAQDDSSEQPGVLRRIGGKVVAIGLAGASLFATTGCGEKDQVIDRTEECLTAIAEVDEDAQELPEVCQLVSAAANQLKDPVVLDVDSLAVEKLAELTEVSAQQAVVDYARTEAAQSRTLFKGLPVTPGSQAGYLCGTAVSSTMNAAEQSRVLDEKDPRAVSVERAAQLLQPAAKAYKETQDMQGVPRLEAASIQHLIDMCERQIDWLAEAEHPVTIIR